ncbi:MAG: hypothetical protein V4710_02490 [Verrucomicrobiota bacterium]
MTRKTQFISVEVVIKTDHSYKEFVQWFTEQDNYVAVVPCDTHQAYIYFAPIPWETPDATIRNLCKQILALPELPRQQWAAAAYREFYIGYDVGEEPACYHDHLSCETLSAALSLGAGVGWALYPAVPTDDAGIPDFTAPGPQPCS